MHIGIRVLLSIIIFLTTVDCQGGSFRSSSRSSRSRSSRQASNCTSIFCVSEEDIQHCKALGLSCILVAVVCLYNWWKRRSIRSNETYVNLPMNEIEMQDVDHFESGFWSSRYYQFDVWHCSHQLMLIFDAKTQRVIGSGFDDVGTYTIDGIYSTKTHRMALTKTYKKGTGDPKQNLGHDVTIQVAWNFTQDQFEGKWFVQTNKYTGENKFELKLQKGYMAIQT